MASDQVHDPAPADPKRPGHWFLRAVAAGIIGYVVIAMLGLPGPGREFAAGALGCGLLAGVVVAIVRGLRRGGLGRLLELLADGVAIGVVVHGLEDLRRRTFR